MTDETIHAVLTGRDNSLNRSILVILQEQEHIRSQLWQVDTTIKKLQTAAAGSIDVLLVDLRSFSGNIIQVIKNISKLEAVKAVLAIHIYTTLKPVEKLIEAGAMGYLPQDTSQQQILDAIESLHRGEPFIGIKEKTGIRENT